MTRSVKWWLLLAAALTSGCGTPGKPPLPKFAVGEAPRRRPKTKSLDRDSSSRGRDLFWPNEKIRGGERAGLARRRGVATQRRARRAWLDRTFRRRSNRCLTNGSGRKFPRNNCSTSSARRNAATGCAQRCVPISCKSRSVRRGSFCAKSAPAKRSPTRNARSCRRITDPRPDAFDNFVDRVSTSARLRRYNVTHLYRAHLAAEQMIAENIVRFMHDNPTVKLLVFLPDDAMINPREVADYVAQKASLQQMILDRSPARPGSGRNYWRGRRSGALEIVNCAPEPFATTAAFPRHGCELEA